MTGVFRIAADSSPAAAAPGPNWSKLALTKNPFPDSGVLGDTLYTEHMPDVVNRVQLWLDDVAKKRVGEPRSPFALEGTIGAGKTHLLRAWRKPFRSRYLCGNPGSSRELVNAGGGRLLLSTLFGTNLRLGEISATVLSAGDAVSKGS